MRPARGVVDVIASSAAREHYRKTLSEAPLAFYNSSPPAYRLIPASFKAFILDDALWSKAIRDSRHVLNALKKVVVWLREAESHGLAKRLFRDFGELEREAAWGLLEAHDELATVRFDFFFEGDDLRILEINSTIPAMQAYGDMVRHAYGEAVAMEGRALPLSRRSNSIDLLQSLCSHYALTGGRSSRPRIGIVARAGDAQIAELKWLQAAWRRHGHDVILGTPDDVTLKNQAVHLGGIPVDLVYRHIFAHRLDPKSAFAEACRRARKYRVFNSISAHLELKGVLAETSRVAGDDGLAERAGLLPEEIAAVREMVPWSRVMREAPDTLPSGESVGSLSNMLKSSERGGIVIKSSSGYGGHGVIIGADFEGAETQNRVQALMGVKEKVTWDAFIGFCSKEVGPPWIAQRLVKGKKWRHDYDSGDTIQRDQDSFIDCSLFGGMFDKTTIPGGAIRFSKDQIVNLGRGGGLVPFLLRSEVAP